MSHARFEFDEIFTRYIARLSAPGGIWDALSVATDNQPFPFYLVTHFSQGLLGDYPFAIRIPETLGFVLN